MLPLCTLALICDLCDVYTVAALGATETTAKLAATEELRKRAACAKTHAEMPKRWEWGVMRMYRDGNTKECHRRILSRQTKMPIPDHALPDGVTKVEVLGFKCKYCEDLHYMQRDSTWDRKGKVEGEGLMRNKNLDHFGIEHPGELMIPRLISILADGGMYPVQR